VVTLDAGVDGGFGDAEACGGLRKGGVLAQVHQGPLGGTELAAVVTFTRNDQHRPLRNECVRQAECTRTGHNKGLWLTS
jgi:hypothetical protein